METVISAVITGVVAIVVCLINSYHQANATRNLIEYKIEELTKRVDKHNNVIDRVYKLEEHEAVVDEQIRVVNHRIKDLEAEP